MQGNTSIDEQSFIALLHMPIHIGVDQSEDDGFITNKGLVVRLGIRDGFLTCTAVRHLIKDMAGFPILITHLFNVFYPEIGYTHCKTIVKTNASIFKRHCKFRKPGHLFGYSDSIRVYFVNKFIGKGKIADSVAILIEVIVITISSKVLTETMISINHRRNTIKAEAVEFILFEPEFTVR